MKLSIVFTLTFATIGTGEIWSLQNIRATGHLERYMNRSVPTAKRVLKCYTVARCITECLISEGPADLVVLFVPSTGMCYCNWDTTVAYYSEAYDVIVWHVLTSEKVEVNDAMDRRVTVWPYLVDCLSLYNANHTVDAVYTIQPTSAPNTTDAWCDMTNGGWTVLQRRKDGSENFNRGWDDYVSGFGNRTGEYWLGLENMHRLTGEFRTNEITFYLEAFPDNHPNNVTIYITGAIQDSKGSSVYDIAVLKSSLGCGSSVFYWSSFSTRDRVNDLDHARNCAAELKGGWWFVSDYCKAWNLNGVYYQYGESGNASDGIRWRSCFDKDAPLKATVIKTRSVLGNVGEITG